MVSKDPRKKMGPADYETVARERQIGRRNFLRWGALGLLWAAIPRPGLAAGWARGAWERALAFHNTHTGEELEAVYWSRGAYRKRALGEIDHILRDYRTDEIKAMDTRLLDLVHALGEAVDARGPFHVISGYRSPKTNAMLRASGHGVAKNSLHMQGKAIDIRLPGCDLRVLRRAAIDLKGGGVGYYPSPNFVHIDVGRVRYW
jgi:uncharacterized protein YcbK (DUF882 family)